MRNRCSRPAGRLFVSRNSCLIALVAGIASVLFATLLPAAEVLDQIISREDPSFICRDAKMRVGLDGMVYFASGVSDFSSGLRINRDGGDKLSGTLLPSPEAITANAQGLIAVAQCHFQRSIALFDRQFNKVAKQDDFLINDDVGFDAPGDVQAGESGDFYGLDQHRNRILRINPAGKIVAVFTLPAEHFPKKQSRTDSASAKSCMHFTSTAMMKSGIPLVSTALSAPS